LIADGNMSIGAPLTEFFGFPAYTPDY